MSESVAGGMSLIVSELVPVVSCPGVAGVGEPAVEAVEFEAGDCRRDSRAERTGRVSIASGEKPSGSGGSSGGAVAEGVAAIASCVLEIEV